MNKTIVFSLFLLLLPPLSISAQKLDAERILHQNILKNFKKDIKEKYYDPKLRGIDIEENVKKASDLINTANSVEEMTDIIVRFLLLFEDSHLFFIPPRRTVNIDYGWDWQIIGDKAFVTSLSEDSDAYKKGIRIGDQLYMLEGFIPNREGSQLLKFHYKVLSPQSLLKIILTKPSGNSYKLDLTAKIKKDSTFMPSNRELDIEAENEYTESTRQLVYDKISGLFVWKMPSFELSTLKIDKMMGKVRKNSSLILDLRGNGGGYIDSLSKLVGYFFDKDVVVGDVIERKGTKKVAIETVGKDIYSKKLVVLIDSESGSAAEVFARIIQLEKRGIVIGDQSAGAVMQSITLFHAFGLDSRIPYGLSVTVADIIMKDGQRLEKVGVTPDEKILPSALDLLNKRDPVLARAAEVLGFKLTPEEAGKIFPRTYKGAK